MVAGGLSADHKGQGPQQSPGSENASLGSSVGNTARVALKEAQLTEAGFSLNEIAVIKAKVPDLNVKHLGRVERFNVDDIAETAIKLRDETGSSVVFRFQGKITVVSEGDSKDQVIANAKGRTATYLNQTDFSAKRQELIKEGYSPEQIAQIREKEPYLAVKIIPKIGGRDIADIAQDAVALSNETGSSVVFKFHDSVTVVSPGDYKHDVVAAAMGCHMSPDQKAMYATYATLPPFFKEWLNYIGSDNYAEKGSTFLSGFDVAIAKDAHLVATKFQKGWKIEEWRKLDNDQQREAVPGFSRGHSPTSLRQVVELAGSYLKREDDKVLAAGIAKEIS